MANNTSELGTTETDMTNWDPDPTDEAPTGFGEAAISDDVTSNFDDLGLSEPTVVSSVEPPERPVAAPLDVTRPVDVARPVDVTRPVTAPIPAQRPSVLPPPAQGSVAPTRSVSVAPPANSELMPPPQSPVSPKLPPRTEWLGTHSGTAPTSQTPPVGMPAPTLGAPGRPSQVQPRASQPQSSQPLAPSVTANGFGTSMPPRMNAPVEAVTLQPSRKVSWIWPAIAAFVLGGLLTGIGFRIGSQSTEPAAPATTTISNTTVPPAVAPPVIDTGAEPAAFVANKLGPSVVTVETDRGLGSGVIFDDGLILTNNHVIEGAGEIQVRLANGGVLDATLVGADPRVDIAVVSVGTGRGLPEAELALGEELQVGELAIAIGSPFQLQQTVTAGIISALNRPVQNGLGFTAMIQTDAPINPGNSGGALANREGRLIGINTAIQTAGDTSNAGVGFAVPIDTAYNVALRIIAGEDLVGGFLGVSGGVSADGASGVEVTSLTAGSGADLAGIRVGDRIISIDGAPVVNLEQLAGIVSTRFPGDDIEIELVRNTRDLVIVATLGER